MSQPPCDRRPPADTEAADLTPATSRRRKLKSFGLRECVEIIDLADRAAKLEHDVEYGCRNNGGADGLGAQGKLDSFRARMRLLLGVDDEAGGDFFRAENLDEADRFRALRAQDRKEVVDKRQKTLL